MAFAVAVAATAVLALVAARGGTLWLVVAVAAVTTVAALATDNPGRGVCRKRWPWFFQCADRCRHRW
jgi:hypothetical protein